LIQGIKDDAWVIVNWEQIRAQKKLIEIPRRNGSVTKKKMWLMKEPLFEVPHAALLDLSLDDLDWKAVEQLTKQVSDAKKARTLGKDFPTAPEPLQWLAVIGDEIHRAKNRNSQQSRGLLRCRADDGIMLGLSGTPMMNEPAELWAILAWLWPDDYHERGTNYAPGARAYWTFFEEYVEYDEGYFGKVITGVKNPDALRFELSGRIIRRTKRMMKLGTKGVRRIPVTTPLNPKQRKLYEEAETALWLEIEQAIEQGDKSAESFAKAAVDGDATRMMKVPNGAARTVRLRQIIETPACLGAEDDSGVLDAFIDKFMDSRPEPWIVFTEFRETCNVLVDRLTALSTKAKPIRAEAYHGDIDPERRRELGKLFQAGEIDVLVGTMKSMREGITLTAGFNQFWVSRDWVPDNNEQGEGRMDRIGQTKQVLAWIAQPPDTVAVSKVAPTNRVKERIVRTILPKDKIEEGPLDAEVS
jgi:SNF2 family DNA or RNA helicase